MLKNVGSDKSVALRGNAKICFLNTEERADLGQLLNLDFRKGTVIGVGYVMRTQKVFFTMNGREVYQMKLPECMLGIKQLYPTFSLGSLRDKIQINFGRGKTQFKFDLVSKVQVSHNFIILELSIFLKVAFCC